MITREEEKELLETYDSEAINAYISIVRDENATKEDFEESYSGRFTSDEDFTQELLEDTGGLPKDLPAYIHIDWESTARDIMMDYTEEDRYYFRNL